MITKAYRLQIRAGLLHMAGSPDGFAPAGLYNLRPGFGPGRFPSGKRKLPGRTDACRGSTAVDPRGQFSDEDARLAQHSAGNPTPESTRQARCSSKACSARCGRCRGISGSHCPLTAGVCRTASYRLGGRRIPRPHFCTGTWRSDRDLRKVGACARLRGVRWL